VLHHMLIIVDIMVLDIDCCTPLLWENIPAKLSRFRIYRNTNVCIDI